jgi:hypothetical protein
MKEYKNAKGERIVEYGFEDWKIGINPIDPNKSGNKKLLIADSEEIYFQYLPYDELKTIRAEQERIYFESVEGYFNMFCKEYEIKFHKSEDKKRLLKTEIEKLEYIFFPEKRANSPIPVGLNMADFGGYDFNYQQEFVLQNIDFSTIEFNENPMLINSRVRTAAYARAKYLNWLKEKLPVKLKTNTESQIQKENNLPIPPKKTFPEYLIHNDREKLAELIKNEFAKEKGKGIRLMLLALEKSNPRLIATDNREMKSIIDSLKLFFGTELGTYQSINDFKYIESKHLADYQGFETRINLILSQISN